MQNNPALLPVPTPLATTRRPETKDEYPNTAGLRHIEPFPSICLVRFVRLQNTHRMPNESPDGSHSSAATPNHRRKRPYFPKDDFWSVPYDDNYPTQGIIASSPCLHGSGRRNALRPQTGHGISASSSEDIFSESFKQLEAIDKVCLLHDPWLFPNRSEYAALDDFLHILSQLLKVILCICS